MKLAVSSLAWDPERDADVRQLLARRGVRGVELAPLKYWPNVTAVSSSTVAEYRAQWADAGISVVALQGILFGMPDLQLFGSPQQQAGFEAHLVAVARLAGALGAPVVVFGAPVNRRRGELSEADAVERAAPLLRRVASAMHDHGTSLCIEPNPPRYGGDFVRTIAEALELARAVDHRGFGVHLDAGALTIDAASDAEILSAARVARHFHVSEVDLVPVGSGTVDHVRMGQLLHRARYDSWVSIEMRPVDDASLITAIEVASRAYLSTGMESPE